MRCRNRSTPLIQPGCAPITQGRWPQRAGLVDQVDACHAYACAGRRRCDAASLVAPVLGSARAGLELESQRNAARRDAERKRTRDVHISRSWPRVPDFDRVTAQATRAHAPLPYTARAATGTCPDGMPSGGSFGPRAFNIASLMRSKIEPSDQDAMTHARQRLWPRPRFDGIPSTGRGGSTRSGAPMVALSC